LAFHRGRGFRPCRSLPGRRRARAAWGRDNRLRRPFGPTVGQELDRQTRQGGAASRLCRVLRGGLVRPPGVALRGSPRLSNRPVPRRLPPAESTAKRAGARPDLPSAGSTAAFLGRAYQPAYRRVGHDRPHRPARVLAYRLPITRGAAARRRGQPALARNVADGETLVAHRHDGDRRRGQPAHVGDQGPRLPARVGAGRLQPAFRGRNQGPSRGPGRHAARRFRLRPHAASASCLQRSVAGGDCLAGSRGAYCGCDATGGRSEMNGVDRRAMAVLSAGHLCTDLAQGSVPALLPFLITRDHLSYATVSTLVLAATISSSVIQPVFGHLSDRLSLPWLMVLGPALGGLGIALAGIVPSFGLTLAAVLVSGIGVAAFHPEGSRFANNVSGERRASGMSLFSVGGNVGFALGPALMTPALLAFGLDGTVLVLVPTWLMAGVLAHELPRLSGFRHDVVAGKVQRSSERDHWGPFAILAGVIAVRSFIYFGLVTFIALYWAHVLHTGKAFGSAALVAVLLGGAAGTLIGGPLADRFGRRAVLIGSMISIPPLVVGLLLSGPTLGIAFAALIGAATISTFSVTIVMGQEYLPGRLGLAAGVTIGLSIG